ncbi:hypothetical protein N9435_09300 [Pseudomonadales bacterium]|nr:hypothetical protein [Pseudomonadales bacterium]
MKSEDYTHGVMTKRELTLTMNGETTQIRTGEWYHEPANIRHAAHFKIETDQIEF